MTPRRRSPNKFAWIRADKLKVHPVAQRKLVQSHARYLFMSLDLDALGIFAVVEDGDDLLIIDGQHRWSALMAHGMGEWLVRIEIHVEAKDDPERASDLFLKLNKRAIVGPFDKFENEVAARYPLAIRTKEICERHGLTPHRQTGAGHITCVVAAKAVCEKDNGDILDAVLPTLLGAFGRTPEAVEGKLVEGLGIVLGQFNGEIDLGVLKKKLAKHPGQASGLLSAGKGLKIFRRISLRQAVAEAILEIYNSGRGSENRLSL